MSSRPCGGIPVIFDISLPIAGNGRLHRQPGEPASRRLSVNTGCSYSVTWETQPASACRSQPADYLRLRPFIESNRLDAPLAALQGSVSPSIIGLEKNPAPGISRSGVEVALMRKLPLDPQDLLNRQDSL